MDGCEQCRFDFDEIGLEEVGPRATAGVAELVTLLTLHRGGARQPLPPGRWTTLEYAAHVRDVLLTIRDRIVIGLVEDNPSFKPMYREERIELGLYRSDTDEAVAAELQAALAMLLRLLGSVERPQLERVVQYGFPGPTERTLLWLAKQAMHEIEHHLDDCGENAVA